MPNPLEEEELERSLRGLSHSEDAIKEIEKFSSGLENTKIRLAVFNADQAMLRSPILPCDTQALGFTAPDDHFVLLQGDVVRTEAAFFFGERVIANPKYIILNSSCDLVPQRRQCVALLRIVEIQESEPDARAKLNLLLKFSKRESMYLPGMPCDDPDILCNAIQFDGICQIRSDDLLANRVASLSLVGWRIFASFSRTVIARANPREIDMRAAVERQPKQQSLTLSP
jgi:hypothetical protein